MKSCGTGRERLAHGGANSSIRADSACCVDTGGVLVDLIEEMHCAEGEIALIEVELEADIHRSDAEQEALMTCRLALVLEQLERERQIRTTLRNAITHPLVAYGIQNGSSSRANLSRNARAVSPSPPSNVPSAARPAAM